MKPKTVLCGTKMGPKNPFGTLFSKSVPYWETGSYFHSVARRLTHCRVQIVFNALRAKWQHHGSLVSFFCHLNYFRARSISCGFVNSNVSQYVINISFLSTTRQRYYLLALALGPQGNLGIHSWKKGFQKGAVAIGEPFWFQVDPFCVGTKKGSSKGSPIGKECT